MTVGLLWFDDAPSRTLEQKIEAAARRHAEKYGTPADTCYVHPSTLNGHKPRVNGVSVKTSPTILPNHFWVGVEKRRA